jgi:hypothetical protein
MTRIRTKRQRPLAFEALEGRLALSTGMAVASHHTHAMVVSPTQKTIPASFKGHNQILNGSELVITNLRGTIGRDHFTGYGTGTVAGTVFQGGTVLLSNGNGTVELGLGTAVVVKAGKHPRQDVSLVVTAATGKYASDVGMTGILNKWNTPAKPSATASFGGFLNP